MLEAAVPHFWASLSAEEQDGARALALDSFGSDWLQHARPARMRQAEDDHREAEADVLARWMVEDLARGGEAAERAISALDSVGADPAAQAAWPEQSATLAPHLKSEAETLERQMRREASKRSGKGRAQEGLTNSNDVFGSLLPTIDAFCAAAHLPDSGDRTTPL